jgi:hypothetical protein
MLKWLGSYLKPNTRAFFIAELAACYQNHIKPQNVLHPPVQGRSSRGRTCSGDGLRDFHFHCLSRSYDSPLFSVFAPCVGGSGVRTSYPGRPELKCLLGNRVFWLKVFIIFLFPSKQLPLSRQISPLPIPSTFFPVHCSQMIQGVSANRPSYLIATQ